MRRRASVIQAWIELRAADPAAVSALAIARAGGATARAPVTLRRMRLFEITGSDSSPGQVATLLHGSAQFYNPHKERCVVRGTDADALPGAAGCERIVVWERDGERRPAAERWWRHEPGETVEVREAVVWFATFAVDIQPGEAARDLAQLRDARHGLLCNPWSQEFRTGTELPSIPWITPAAEARVAGEPAVQRRTRGGS